MEMRRGRLRRLFKGALLCVSIALAAGATLSLRRGYNDENYHLSAEQLLLLKDATAYRSLWMTAEAPGSAKNDAALLPFRRALIARVPPRTTLKTRGDF